jgi:hypothetical protein
MLKFGKLHRAPYTAKIFLENKENIKRLLKNGTDYLTVYILEWNTVRHQGYLKIRQ